MSRLYINYGPGWTNVPDGNRVRYWNGGGYVDANQVRVWNGGGYVTVWTRSNPITATFYATATIALRQHSFGPEYDPGGSASNNAHSDLWNGRYNGSWPRHHTSILRFTGGANEGYGTIAQILTTHPAVKSATLRLNRVSGGLGSPSGYLRVGSWKQLGMESLPATTLDGTYHDFDPHYAGDVAGWQYGWNRNFAVPPQCIYDHNAGYALMFAEVTSGFLSTGGTTAAYMMIRGIENAPNVNYLPMLTVTFDVV